MITFEEFKLEDCIDTLIDYRGKSPKKSTGIPVISAKVVKNGRILNEIEQQISFNYYSHWMNRGIPACGDIVLTTEGPLGEVAQLNDITKKYALGQRIITLRMHKNINSTYIKYALMSPLMQNRLNMLSTGTTVIGISQKSLLKLKIPIPNRKNQDLVAKVLSDLDQKIEINRQMNETLEQMAQAVFKDWFVDFGPVKRKMEGVSDPVAVLGGLIADAKQAKDIASLFPDKFSDDGLPEGWSVKPLCDLAERHTSSLNPQLYPLKLFEHYSLPAYDKGMHPEVSYGKVIKSQKYVIPQNSILLSKLNPETKRIWFNNIERNLTKICSTEFMVYTPRGSISCSYLYCLFNSSFFYKILNSLVSGTSKSHQRVSPKSLDSKKFINPEIEISLMFHSIIGPKLDLCARNMLQNQTLAEMRDLLLPKLMSGEISVDNLASQLEDVL